MAKKAESVEKKEEGPFRFSCKTPKPTPETVGELIDLLKQLPTDMPIVNNDGSEVMIQTQCEEEYGPQLVFIRDGD